MTNSPAKDIEDPMIGQAGKDASKANQQTGTQQRPDASNAEGKSGAETPGGQAGISAAAISSANDAADKLAGASRKEVETGKDSQ